MERERFRPRPISNGMNFIHAIIVFVGHLKNFAGIIIAFIGSVILQVIGLTGYAGVFFLMALESAAIPIPSEITMPFSGFLAAKGVFDFWLVVVVGALGNLIGSLALYWLGEYGGRIFVLRWGYLLLLEEAHLTKAEQWFKKYGAPAVFFGRLLPVVRTYVSLPAGMAKMNLWKFSAYTVLGSFPWSLLLAYVGFKLGERWNALEPYFRKFDIIILFAVLLAVIWFFYRLYGSRKEVYSERENI